MVVVSIYGVPVPKGHNMMCDTCDAKQKVAETRTSGLWSLKAAGLISPKLITTSWDLSDQELIGPNRLAWDEVKEIPETKNLYIYGATSTGKTHLARCYLRDWHDAGHSIAEIKATRYLSLALRFDKSPLDSFIEAAHLLLDDLDKHTWQPRDVSPLWELMDHRADSGRQTIVTSNLAPDALTKFLMTVVPSNTSIITAALERLNPCVTIKLVGDSIRRKLKSTATTEPCETKGTGT